MDFVRIGLFLIVSFFIFRPAFAADNDERGLMPSLRLDSKSEDENDRRAMTTELMVTRAESKAIDALQKILQRKKGSEQEPELLHRLSELYMRRARTGRFFDLHKDSKTLKFSAFPIPPEKGLDWIRKSVGVYVEMEKRFPKYDEMDSILFNHAFAMQQLGKIKDAESLYEHLIKTLPNSRLIPDTSVALGELNYDQARFAVALDNFERVKRYPENRVYTYGLYKMAWSHYNMKDSQGGIEGLLDVLKACPADAPEGSFANRQNLRKEALRDMTLFVSDSKPAGELYAFFKGITNEDELGQAMQDLSKLYLSHGKLKDLAVFTQQFNEHNPDNHARVKLMLSMTEAAETERQRDHVVDLLQQVGSLCKPTSSWRALQSPEHLSESCGEAFPAKVHELAAKWWDVWEKNKTHAEFSDLTEKLLKIVLDNEDPKNPDIATRFADAELLFQRAKFEEASQQYATTAQEIADNPKSKVASNLFHDADYGALFSMEKAVALKKDDLLEQRRKELAELYLKRQPKGAHASEVTLRLAVISFEEKNYEAAQKRLQTVLAGEGGRDLQRKAEDLDLEILNVQKKYADLTKHVEIDLKREKLEDRKAQLKKIELEASYASLQDDLKKMKSAEASTRLRTFAESHTGNLASDALFQSAALDFLEGRGLAGAETVNRFAKENPKDPRLSNALMDAANAAAQAGEMAKAADYLRQLADKDAGSRTKNIELASDYLRMEGKIGESRSMLKALLTNAPASERPRLLSKLLETYKNEPQSPEIAKLEGLILSENIEPFATQVLTRRVQAILAAGDATRAFEAARKIISRDSPAGARAEARLIQARILENELIHQSVKSSKEAKFALVLAMKTEKLDKAQTAYLSASRMTSDPKLLADAFAGADRCAANYIESLEGVKPPESLSEQEQAALKKEIAKSLEPIRQQRDSNRQEIRKLASVSTTAQKTSWSELPADNSPVPTVPSSWSFLKPYVEKSWSDDVAQIARSEGQGKCDSKKPDFAGCFLKGNWEASKTLARDLTQNKATRVQGWHDLALVADAQGLHEKALWLLKLAQTESPNHPLISYEKGRILSEVDGSGAAGADFAAVLASSMSSTEIRILQGFQAFSEGDFTKVKSIFSGFSVNEIYNLKIGLVLSEALAQSGEADQALKLIADLSKVDRDSALMIQQGRLNEVYKFAPVQALEAYSQAMKIAKDPAQKDWLVRKTEYLKVNFKVGLHVTSGD